MLNLSGCRKLKKFPDIISGSMGRLSETYLDKTGIRELPSSIGNLSDLTVLSLSSCSDLESLPSTICGLKSLKTVHLTRCSQLQQLPDNIGSMEQLEELSIHDCRLLDRLPCSMTLLTNLRSLSFTADGFWPFPPNSLSSFCSLSKLYLRGSQFPANGFPLDIISLPSLEELDLRESNIVVLPGRICQLSHLKVLTLDRCPSLKEVQELSSSLQVLSARHCSSLGKLKDLSENHAWRYMINFSHCPQLIENQQRDNYITHKLLKSLLQGRSAVNHRFNFVIPGSKIPDWFRQQKDSTSSMGDEAVFKLPPNWQKQVLGFAICCVSQSSLGEDPYMNMRFRIANDNKVVKPMMFDIGSSTASENDGTHLWIGYISVDFLQQIYYEDFQPEDWSKIEVYLTIGQLYSRASKFEAAHIVYKEDLVGRNKMIGLGAHIFEYGTVCRKDHDGYEHEILFEDCLHRAHVSREEFGSYKSRVGPLNLADKWFPISRVALGFLLT